MANRTLVISASTAWYIAHFAAELIRRLGDAGYELVAAAPADAANADPNIAAEFLPIGMARAGMNPLADLKLLLDFRRLLKRVRPAAFLGFTIKPNIYGSLAAQSLGIPCIANVNGLGTAFIRGGPLERIASILYRAAFRRHAAVFFHNPDDQRLFIERGLVTPAQAKLIPGSGIDLEQFLATPLPDGPPVFLLIGRLLRDKGVREFVDAARLVRGHLTDARFQLLGAIDQGNRTAIARSQLDSWVAEGVVEHLGETDDVRPFIARSTAVVLPSYREGLPRALLEGAAMGRPLIATDVPGCREVVEEGVNGLFCEPRDAASLADAMRRLASAPRSRQVAMAHASRERVKQRFSVERVASAYLAVLEDINSH